MEILPIEVFGVHVDVPFPRPVPLGKAGLDEFGSKACDPATGLGLRPENVRLKRWDDLFGYELAAQFFGDNGVLTRAADRVKLGVRNARTLADWNIIQQTFLRFYNLMDFDPTTITTLSTHVHARFHDSDERDEWMSQFSFTPLVHKAASLGYVRILDWEKDIRVLMEPSNLVPDAVFVAWDTQFTNDQHWESFLGSIITMMENAANTFDLGFEPLRERV